jgi:hypothetical protein
VFVSVVVLATVATPAYAAIPDDEPEPSRAPPVTAPKPPPASRPAPSPPVAPAAPRRQPTGPVPWPTSPDEIIPDVLAPAPPSHAPASAPGRAPASAPAPVAASAAPVPAVAPGPSPQSTTFDLWMDAHLHFDRDFASEARLRWLVAAIDHRPAPWVRLYGAVELESGTRFGPEQLHIGLTPHPLFGVRAGLLLLPLGIINLHHQPPSYLTVDRPLTDLVIIPTTWRELGVEIFGELAPGLTYQLQVVSGLDAAKFSAAAPLAGGRGNGRTLAIHNAAFVGRLAFTIEGFTLGGGGYYGGADAGHPELDGVRAGVAEADVSFRRGGFELRAEVAELFIVNSWKVNDYLGLLGQDAVPARGRGGYVQAGYDILRLVDESARQELVFFGGYENVNARSRMSAFNYNLPTITGPGELPPAAPSQAHALLRGGFCYRPWPSVAFKGDIQYALRDTAPVPVTPVPLAGAPGKPIVVPDDLAAASRARTLVGVSLALAF